MTDENVRSMFDEPDGDIQRLLEFAGPRVQPPDDVAARVHAATMAAVDALPDRRAGSHSRRNWAVAATILLVAGVGYLLMPFASREAPVAEILYATGGYTIRGSDSGSTLLQPGAIVQTSKGGRLFVGLGDSRTLRIDHGASLTVHSAAEIWLHSGRIYVDARGGQSVRVVTPFASVTDLGTLFEVTVSGESLVIAIREGRVDVQLGDRQVRSEARDGLGEELVIDGLALSSRTAVPTVDERWQWTQQSRPLFGVAGRSVHQYLEWAARESGRALRYRSQLARQQSALRRLSGKGEVDADSGSVGRLLRTTSFAEFDSIPHELLVGLQQEQ